MRSGGPLRAGRGVSGGVDLGPPVGDDHNALLMLTVEAAFVPDAAPITLPAARLYLIDDDDKITVEQVVFFVPD